MKITGYNASVNPNVANARVQNVGDMMAYGGNGSGLTAISKALGQVNLEYQKIAEEEDKRMLMSAMDTYNKGRYDILYNDENGVMNTKLDGASNSVATYQEREAKLRNDIMGNLKFKTKQYQNVFADMVNKSAQQGFQLVDRHQYQEGEKQKDVVFNNNLQNQYMMVQKNYNNDSIVNDAIEQVKLLVSARYQDMGQEFIDNATKTAASKIGKSVVEEAIMRGDYEVAQKSMKFFDAVFTPEMRDSLEKSLFTKGKNDYIMNLAEDLQRRYGEDIGGIMAELNNTNAFGTDRLMNLAERQNVLNMAQSIINTNKAIEKANFDKVFDTSLDSINGMIEQGTSYANAMKWAEEQAGSNIKNLKALQNAVNICYGRASGAGFKGIPVGDWNAIDVMLRNGDFETEEEYMSYLAESGADKKQIVDGRQRYKDFKNGTGKYAYEFDELKTVVMGKDNLKDGEQAKWDGAVSATGDEIADFIIKHKRQPSKYEVIEMLSNNMTKGIRINYQSNPIWWGTISATNAELALMGIKNITQQDNEKYIVEDMKGIKQVFDRESVISLVDKAKGAVK